MSQPRPTYATGDFATREFVFVARQDIVMPDGEVFYRGTIVPPGTFPEPFLLAKARKLWALDAEAVGFVVASHTRAGDLRRGGKARSK